MIKATKVILDDSEMEIVKMAMQCVRNKEISEKLRISEDSVRSRLNSICDKVGVSCNYELALYAIHHRLLPE
jgi:DNA-binding NarL/FixJ family response regulator